MIKRKVTKESLAELATRIPVLSEIGLRNYVGGQDPSIVYKAEQYHILESTGLWTQTAYVSGMGYVLPTATVTGTYTDYEKYFDDNYSFNSPSGTEGGSSTNNDMNSKLASAIAVNTSVKEALFKLAARTGDLGKAVNGYLRVNNSVGALSGVFNTYVSLEAAFEKPTPGNVSKAVVSTVFVTAQIAGRYNPWTGLVLSIADVSGLSTLVYEGIDKLTNSN